MSSLLDLPAELLTLVAEEVGGGELRRDVGNLTLCRKWYDAALPVFHSGMHTKGITIYGCNVNRLGDRGSYSEDRKLMHKNTREIAIHLLGHWRDQSSDDDFAIFSDDPKGVLLGKQDREAHDNDPYVYGERSEWSALHEWQTNVLMTRLEELFGDLRRFTHLRKFTFECMVGATNFGQPIRNYLSAPRTIGSCFSNLLLVPSLQKLTIDLCAGFALDADTHWCELVSKLIPKVAEVRVRMTPICSHIFDTPDNLSASDVKLKVLIVKLHQAADAAPRSEFFSPSICRLPEPGVDFDQVVIRRTRALLENLSYARDPTQEPASHGGLGKSDSSIKLARISFVESPSDKICVVDCLTLLRSYPQTGWPPEDLRAHQLDGSPCWFEDGSQSERFDELEFNQPYELGGGFNE